MTAAAAAAEAHGGRGQCGFARAGGGQWCDLSAGRRRRLRRRRHCVSGVDACVRDALVTRARRFLGVFVTRRDPTRRDTTRRDATRRDSTRLDATRRSAVGGRWRRSKAAARGGWTWGGGGAAATAAAEAHGGRGQRGFARAPAADNGATCRRDVGSSQGRLCTVSFLHSRRWSVACPRCPAGVAWVCGGGRTRPTPARSCGTAQSGANVAMVCEQKVITIV